MGPCSTEPGHLFVSRVVPVYFSPPETLLPHNALLPHSALLPHNALLPHKALLPQSALLPHSAFEPQRALLPHKAFEPVMVELGTPLTNSDDPHTAELAHVADVFQTAEGSSVR